MLVIKRYSLFMTITNTQSYLNFFIEQFVIRQFSIFFETA